MNKIIVKQKVTNSEAEKIAKSQGYNTIIMISSSENQTIIYVA